MDLREIIATIRISGDLSLTEMPHYKDHGAAANLVGERREAQIHAFVSIALGLAVERLVLPILPEQNHGQSAEFKVG